MSEIKFYPIFVISHNLGELQKIHLKAHAYFRLRTSEINSSGFNNYYSFFVSPLASKNDLGDDELFRVKFFDLINELNASYQFECVKAFEIEFSDVNDNVRVSNRNLTDFEKQEKTFPPIIALPLNIYLERTGHFDKKVLDWYNRPFTPEVMMSVFTNWEEVPNEDRRKRTFKNYHSNGMWHTEMVLHDNVEYNLEHPNENTWQGSPKSIADFISDISREEDYDLVLSMESMSILYPEEYKKRIDPKVISNQ